MYIEQVEWLADWNRHVQPARQRGYIKEELERLAASGSALLYTCLTAPLEVQRDLAVSALREIQPNIWLRLKPGAVPPSLDPQGRDLPDADRGKLVAKVGQVGQMRPDEIKGRTESGETAAYTSEGRQSIARSKKGLYETRRIDTSPRAFPLDEAITIMRAWGVGMREPQFRRVRQLSPKIVDGVNVNEGLWEQQDMWLVEEIPQRDNQPIMPREQKPAEQKSKAA